MTGQVLIPDAPYKPQGDPKTEVLSLQDAFLPKVAAPFKSHSQGEWKKKYKTLSTHPALTAAKSHDADCETMDKD